jgi:hypothetical protein
MGKEKSVQELKDQYEPDPKVRALQNEIITLKHTIDTLRLAEGEIEKLTAEVRAAVEVFEPIGTLYIPPEEKKVVESPVSCVLHLTDWHIGMTQVKDEIEGFNMFNFEVGTDRVLTQLPKALLDWITIQRLGYKIENLVVLVTGDLISGDIHKELTTTNEFPTPVQTAKAGYLLAEFLQLLAPHFKEITVHFISADNHSRLTKKPQAKEEGYNTLNYLVGTIADQALNGHNNIFFNIYPQYFKSVKVENTRYLITHGHNIQGWAGFPWYGVERQVGREAVKRMNAPDWTKFDKLVLGHFHTPLNHPRYMVGGSLSGTDAYDHKAGRESNPCQCAWLVHPQHGDNFSWFKIGLN